MFPSRSIAPEILDDMSIEDDRVDRALDELNVINRWLGGHRTSRIGIEQITRSIPAGRRISILDVGAGGSDLAEGLQSLDLDFVVTSLDMNRGACRYSRRLHSSMNIVCGSAFALPFKDRSFDIAHASQFLHHFPEIDARMVLSECARVARYGIVINDLHRHPFAYAAIVVLTRIFSRSREVQHDGPVSVLRAFHRNEIYSLLATIPHASITLSRRWAFRWCATASFVKP